MTGAERKVGASSSSRAALSFAFVGLIGLHFFGLEFGRPSMQSQLQSSMEHSEDDDDDDDEEYAEEKEEQSPSQESLMDRFIFVSVDLSKEQK